MVKSILAALVASLSLTVTKSVAAAPLFWLVENGRSKVFPFESMGIKADTPW